MKNSQKFRLSYQRAYNARLWYGNKNSVLSCLLTHWGKLYREAVQKELGIEFPKQKR